MKDINLDPRENNMIDCAKKVAQWGIFHNFNKNPEIISFNSKLANQLFVDLVSSRTNKIEYHPDTSDIYATYNDNAIKNKMLEMVKWLDNSCSGYYVMVDYNVFFQLEEDKASFLIKFVQ
jgi:hypothetical protein